jgi:fluoride exporter
LDITQAAPLSFFECRKLIQDCPAFSEKVWDLQKILLLALAGAIGTLARYGLGGYVQRVFGAEFPWGTLVVNVVGCFVFGCIWTLAEESALIGPEMRTVATIGFLGAFTTFSSFMFETGALLRESEWLLAAGNVAAQNVIGIVFLFLGMALGRLVF